MIPLQYDFFEENDEISLMKKEMSEIKKSCDKQRKSQFALINSISKQVIEIKEELYSLRMAMMKREK